MNWCQFHHHFTSRFLRRKKDSQIKQLFSILGPASIKNASDEIDPWCWRLAAFNSRFLSTKLSILLHMSICLKCRNLGDIAFHVRWSYLRTADPSPCPCVINRGLWPTSIGIERIWKHSTFLTSFFNVWVCWSEHLLLWSLKVRIRLKTNLVSILYIIKNPVKLQ